MEHGFRSWLLKRIHAGRHVYDPQVTGWLNFSIHMIGTSVIIAIIEEFSIARSSIAGCKEALL